MKDRWERQKEVFEIIKDNESISVGELAEILEIDGSLANSLLRHYHKNKYLKREPNPENNYGIHIGSQRKVSSNMRTFLVMKTIKCIKKYIPIKKSKNPIKTFTL